MSEMAEQELTLDQVGDEIEEKDDGRVDVVEEEKEQSATDVLETLRPSADPVDRVVGPEGEQRTYTQKPLSFFGKMDFYALVGQTIDEAMSSGMSLDALIGDSSGLGTSLTAANFTEADSIVATIGKLAHYAPELLIDSYCIWLNVPMNERQWFKLTVVKPVDEGGLSDEDGLDIINVFIAQNAEAMENFFTKQLPLVSKTFRKSRGGK